MMGENMTTITYAQLQELIAELPEAKFAIAYELLLRLARQPESTSMTATDFMRLPLHARRRLMEEQATYMMDYYEQTAAEREEWQVGDFSEN
jgi:hypothetical protein